MSSTTAESIVDMTDDQPPRSSSSGSRPARPSRAEYAAYSAILSDLDFDDRHDLTNKLVRGRTSKSKLELNSAQKHVGARNDDEEILEDDDAELESTGHVRGPRRVDGPTFAPSYQDASVTRKRKRKSTTMINRQEEFIKWPLAPVEMYQTSSATLEETVMAFTSSYIRTHRLTLQGSKVKSDDVDDFPILPDNFLASVREDVNKVLVGLATARPVEVKQRRKKMSTMDWSGVLAAAAMLPELRSAALTSNARLRQLYQPEETDILSHRIDILNRPRPPNPAESLYLSVLPKQDRSTRPHQSKAEMATRNDRRQSRMQKKQAKEVTKPHAKSQRSKSCDKVRYMS